jgi:UPF0755 protein
MRPFRTLLKSVFLLGLAALLGGGAWLVWEIRAPAASGSGTVLFEIEKGQSVRTVAEALKTRGLLRKSRPFILLYELFYKPRNIKAGEYNLPTGLGARETLETLLQGKVYLHPVTVAEGLTGVETFAVFIAASFGTKESFTASFANTSEIALLDPQAADLEGYLYPETYHLPKGIGPADILALMVSQFKDVFRPAERRRAAEIGMTPREVVILASLIEKETGRPEEKSLVSAVFHNRLRIGMKLDCDPTILYALKREGSFDGPLRTKDLKFDSPYNTYLYRGLPPGPICNPGRASIEAALHPASADFIYFVANREGGHIFSRTLSEHQVAVQAYRRR